MKRKNIYVILSNLCLLILLSIACRQSGEIITPAEATQRYEATQAAGQGEASGDAQGAVFLTGSSAQLAGESYLVGLYARAGDTAALTFATRGDKVTILGSLDLDGEIWYKVETNAGDGWLPGEILAPAE